MAGLGKSVNIAGAGSVSGVCPKCGGKDGALTVEGSVHVDVASKAKDITLSVDREKSAARVVCTRCGWRTKDVRP